MPRIIFIRPAQTDYRLNEEILGRSDPDINEVGRLEARALASALSRYPIDYIAVSPIRRAIATAMPIEDVHDLYTHPVDGFQAMDMGDWEDSRIDIINSTDRARYESWLKDPDFPAPGGESLREVYARAYPALLNIVEHAEEGETIALVLQHAVMRALCCAMLNLPLEAAKRFYMDNASFGVFERIYTNGPYQLIGWNNNAHLMTEDDLALEMEGELPGV